MGAHCGAALRRCFTWSSLAHLQVHSGTPIKVFVKRPGSNYAEVEAPASASVAALAKAVILELKLDVGPDAVTLKLEGAAEPLDSRKRLVDAGVKDGTSLIVEVQARARDAAGALLEVLLHQLIAMRGP